MPDRMTLHAQRALSVHIIQGRPKRTSCTDKLIPIYIHDDLIFAYVYSGIIAPARCSVDLISWYIGAIYAARGRFSSLNPIDIDSTFFGGSLLLVIGSMRSIKFLFLYDGKQIRSLHSAAMTFTEQQPIN